MNKYDKIYVHCHSMQSNLEIVLEPGECGKSVKIVDNVLVMTIEELREVWEMAKSVPDHPGVFELFLKSKGIIL